MLFLQSEYNVRLSKIESERQTLAETLAVAERRGGEEKARADDLQLQLKSTKATAESAKQEFQDYKNKASRILQVIVLNMVQFESRILFKSRNIKKVKQTAKLTNRVLS